ALAFRDDVEGDADRVLRLFDRLIEVGDFAGLQAARELNNCSPFKTSFGGFRQFASAEESNNPLGNVNGQLVDLLLYPILPLGDCRRPILRPLDLQLNKAQDLDIYFARPV